MKKIFLLYLSLGAIPVYSANYPAYLTMENIGSLSNNLLDMDNNNNNAHLLQNELLNVDNDTHLLQMTNNPDNFTHFDFNHDNFDLSALLFCPSNLQHTTTPESAVLQTPYERRKLKKTLKTSSSFLQDQTSSSADAYDSQATQNDPEKENLPKKSSKKAYNTNSASYSKGQASSSTNRYHGQPAQKNQKKLCQPLLENTTIWQLEDNYYFRCPEHGKAYTDSTGYKKHIKKHHKDAIQKLKDAKKKKRSCAECRLMISFFGIATHKLYCEPYLKRQKTSLLRANSSDNSLKEISSQDVPKKKHPILENDKWDPNENYNYCVSCEKDWKDAYANHLKRHPKKEAILLKKARGSTRDCICGVKNVQGVRGLKNHKIVCTKYKPSKTQ